MKFDIESDWKPMERNWDLIHVRTLFGAVRCWEDMYRKIHRFESHSPTWSSIGALLIYWQTLKTECRIFRAGRNRLGTTIQGRQYSVQMRPYRLD